MVDHQFPRVIRVQITHAFLSLGRALRPSDHNRLISFLMASGLPFSQRQFLTPRPARYIRRESSAGAIKKDASTPIKKLSGGCKILSKNKKKSVGNQNSTSIERHKETRDSLQGALILLSYKIPSRYSFHWNPLSSGQELFSSFQSGFLFYFKLNKISKPDYK